MTEGIDRDRRRFLGTAEWLNSPRLFDIEFLDGGVETFAFTFG